MHYKDFRNVLLPCSVLPDIQNLNSNAIAPQYFNRFLQLNTAWPKDIQKDMHVKRQRYTLETLSASSIPLSFSEALDTCFGGELIEVCKSDSYIGVGCRAKWIERKPPPQKLPNWSWMQGGMN